MIPLPPPPVAHKPWMSRAATPLFIFPVIAVIALAMIWGATYKLIGIERAAAEHAVAVSGRELAETYEAQVVRALREIDQTLKLVKYAYERGRRFEVLQELKASALLPPELLFGISIADRDGNIVAGTRPPAQHNVASEDYFRVPRGVDTVFIGQPPRLVDDAKGKLQFSRRLSAPDGSFAGVVIISVDIAYFVSGYDAAKLGAHGMLGIVGTDGVFRARRSGDKVNAGDTVGKATIVSDADDEPAEARLVTNPWDGVQRYTSARQLFEFPLAVIVGLSADEQLAPARAAVRLHALQAGTASVVLLVVIFALWRMSRQLARARKRAAEEQVAHAARVEYLAYHDGLTALPNRTLFSKLLGQSISQARRYRRQLAVIFLDLDGFKAVNDTLGHEGGDALLKQVAVRLRECLRDSDTVARLGGDEFVALLPELTQDKYAAIVAQKILAAIARPFMLDGQEVRVSASIGISVYPEDGTDEQALGKNADTAMYKAKQEGKNNFQFYSETLNASSAERLSLEKALRHGLERGEFELHYQAKRDVQSGTITGVEALLRWRPDGGDIVEPGRFLPFAEETGLIVPIGRWVLMTACRQNAAWHALGLPRLTLSVNLSARQFNDPELLGHIGAALAESGMEAGLLELEITEALLIGNVERALKILDGLKDIGVRIAIDDFGAGYASLSLLKRFPLNTIKIDRSFIRDLTSGREDKAITRAIIAMGRTLSLTVVAQGVETKEQADYLRENACDEFQGYYLNVPMAPADIAELLRAQGKLPHRHDLHGGIELAAI
ncbi:hypothetical protein DSM104443_02240 [Usitatibacter rugosus]|uniref:Diguanylate cyclase (GGDEF)-like protein n=1 Tax=Usitatibacter rugosus TaxID=2732067 RepID=A0A6M4GWC2_9PROT|nr:EAL domain-containing protein [Usitatibacter rugosus]QJR11168.1 hypothetical protein DSM104443_02240 [Usitatibacter rugosus]